MTGWLYAMIIAITIWTSVVGLQEQALQRYYVSANGSASLQCELQRDGYPVEWYRGSILNYYYQQGLDNIVNGTDSGGNLYSQDDSSHALNITRFNKHYDGPYTCKVEYSEAEVVYSCPNYLVTAEIGEEFVTGPTSQTVYIHNPVILECDPPHSRPPPHIYWMKDGLKLQNAVISNRGNLYIHRADMIDSGYYQCVAVNHISGRMRHSESAYLNVTGIVNHLVNSINVSFTDDVNDMGLQSTTIDVFRSENITKMIGESLELECTYGSNWQRMGQPLPSTAIVEPYGILKINSLNANDGGVYTCLSEGQIVLNVVGKYLNIIITMICVG
jgi:hypothetical protein